MVNNLKANSPAAILKPSLNPSLLLIYSNFLSLLFAIRIKVRFDVFDIQRSKTFKMKQLAFLYGSNEVDQLSVERAILDLMRDVGVDHLRIVLVQHRQDEIADSSVIRHRDAGVTRNWNIGKRAEAELVILVSNVSQNVA